jgi:hypothetical protein
LAGKQAVASIFHFPFYHHHQHHITAIIVTIITVSSSVHTACIPTPDHQHTPARVKPPVLALAYLGQAIT